MTKFFIATITALALVGASTSAFAKPQGNGNHHNHWHGGGIYISSYEPVQECYMVTRYSHGRPILVEVCD